MLLGTVVVNFVFVALLLEMLFKHHHIINHMSFPIAWKCLNTPVSYTRTDSEKQLQAPESSAWDQLHADPALPFSEPH